MSNSSTPKPFLTSDAEYTQQVASVIKAKEPIEILKLEYLNNTLKSFGIEDNPYSMVSLENLNPESLKTLISLSFERINSNELNQEQSSNLYQLWDYLSEENKLEKSDLIFVFGGPNDIKAIGSAKLYKEEWAPKIMYTGNKASYIKDSNLSESEYLKNIAIKEGVKEQDIIIENQSINSTENAVFGIKKLKDMNFNLSKIILVTLPYHMRRSSLTLMSAINDKNVKVIKNIAPSAKYTRENYFKDLNG
jgi:hypothetical protein